MSKKGAIVIVGCALAAYYLGWLRLSEIRYEANLLAASSTPSHTQHIDTPEPLKAIYMTSYVAGVEDWRQKILKLIAETELNAIVIDIKDYTGVLVTKRAPDIAEYIKELHEHNVYVIGRISVFQDQKYVSDHPELAVLRKDNGGVWRDRKGIAWLDPGSKEVWDYVIGMAKESYAAGFDEINFDYIRFPSDGDMDNIYYPHVDPTLSRPAQMKLFYAYLDKELRSAGIPISADLFGQTATNLDDMGIGQLLENALPHFDFICPMVYPSHYARNFGGWSDPNLVPGEIVRYSMITASARVIAASSSPYKLRPWLQDFDYGGDYGPNEVRAQIEGVYDAGLTSWMLWDPGVKYTPAALLPS